MTRLAAALALLAAAPAAAEPVVTTTKEGKVHMLSLRYDYGARGSTVGLAYYYAFESSEATNGLGAGVWYGPGLDLRVTTEGAFVASLAGRVEGISDAGGSGLEVNLGLGSGGDGVQGVASVGVFFGLYYFDLGYSYQFPVGPFSRPDWMSSHQFSVRAHIPLHRWDESERTTTQP